ncbi:two-component system sensor histidine kinase NtrB [Thermosulfuriphilus sp.]
MSKEADLQDIRLEGEQRFIRAEVFDVLPEMVLVVDQDRRVLAANRAAQVIVGAALKLGSVRTGELLACLNAKGPGGCGYNSFCSFCLIKNALEECLETGEPIINREGMMILEEQAEIKIQNFLLNCLPFDLAGKKVAVLSLSDITELKTMEAQRYEQLERLSLIGSMAASLVHDLKNPLTGISGFVELLKSRCSDERLQNLCQKIELALGKVFEVIDNILLVASGRKEIPLNLNEVELACFLEALVADSRLSHPVYLILNYQGPILIDEDKMRQVLWNLLKNADEALQGRPEGRIDIFSWPSGEDLILCVADNGPGISPEIKGKIFLPGQTYGKVNGRGFGLFGSKKIVEAHGGQMWFETYIGKGTKFFIKLPIRGHPSS